MPRSARSAAESCDLLLGHGASGTAASMQPWCVALAAHGVVARAIDLPRGRAERALPAYAAQLSTTPGSAVGGHSFGGRVASMLAATTPVSALVLLSYPLHRPGHPEELRTAHWPDITCPVLLLSGDRDPFARIDLLRAAIPTLSCSPRAELAVFPGCGHGLLPIAEPVAERIAAFLQNNGARSRGPGRDRPHA